MKSIKLPTELARELTYCGVGTTLDGFTVVAFEALDQSRWTQHMRIIIRGAFDQYYVGYYETGLTENQEMDPWEYESEAEFSPVFARQRVVTYYTERED